MNYLLVLEYDGSNYNGWQIQNKNSSNGAIRTIESEVIKAIKIVTGFSVKLSVSGRTDTGVHALNQIVNFKTPFYYDICKLKLSLTGVMPKDISVKNIEIVHDSFHATYDTVSKIYLYKINNGFKSPLLSNYSWFVKDKLNIELMKSAALILTGRNNFINFAKKDKTKKPTDYYRLVKSIDICPVHYGFEIFVEGEGFLRNMVRRIVGSIAACGSGKIEQERILQMIKQENFLSSAYNAPPFGLFLYSVSYKHKIYR